MDKATAESIRIGTWLYHSTLRNRDGTALRARVNGKCKTWKREPGRFQLPMKHGLHDCFYITQANAYQWLEYDNSIEEERVKYFRRYYHQRYTEEMGLDSDTPWQIVHDMLLEREQVRDAENLKYFMLVGG